jgi:site-specific DNA-methyltransferase (adenine-specific)
MKLRIENADCMEVMAEYPDNYFDLAVIDPPYGINIAEWDKHTPTDLFFNELFRISKNQIIWGGNYFKLPHNEAWICWDKTYRYNQKLQVAEFELAWSSFKHKSMFLRFTYCGNFYGLNRPKAHYDKPKNIHPTQKPQEIYEMIYQKFCSKDFKLIDTHLGSGSSLIAADKFGVAEFVGCEIDKEYFDAAMLRYKIHKQQSVINFNQ